MVTDWLGTEIKPGSIIVYPGRQGSSMWMRKAKVTSVFPYEVMRRDYTNWPSELVVTQKFGLFVEVEQANYTGDVVGHRKVKLTRLDRVTVVG